MEAGITGNDWEREFPLTPAAEDDEVALFCVLWEVETAPEIGQTEEIVHTTTSCGI